MRLIIAIAFTVSLVSVDARASFVFSDIPWNAPAETVVKKLKVAGFKQIKRDKQGDYAFRGNLLGHDAGGMAMFARGKLVKVIVSLATPEEMVRETYQQVREVLLTKYGQPMRTLAAFVEPFHEGDGYEAEAIRSGKGIFLTQWSDAGQQLAVNITPGLTVAVTYESQDWAGELERRKNKGSAAF
ncbi:MAG TPA: hypothetical protein VIM68_05095 [Thermoanaerobaculia bacterium]